MKPYSDDSFFHQHYDNLKVLVFVPHQDDEINTTGTLLYGLSQCKAQITLVYSTNGDWEYPAERRFKEAINTAATSPTGYSETYGTNTHPDFAFLHEKQHHSYSSENYLKDLLSIIRKIKADVIISTDFDHHADHRMMSLYLDKAIGIIKKRKSLI